MRSLAVRPTAVLAAALIALGACGDDADAPTDAPTDATEQTADDQAADVPADAEEPATDDGDEAADDATDDGETDATDATDDDASLTCDDLAGVEQDLLDAAGVGEWTGDAGGFDGLCSIDGADGFVSVFTASEATPEAYFASNDYGSVGADGDVVTAANEFGVPAAGTVVDGRVVLATIDGTVEPADPAAAAAALRVALDALAG